MVHELGHAWDKNNDGDLSRELEEFTGGSTSWLAGVVKRLRGECDRDRRLPGCNRAGYFYEEIPPAGSDTRFNREEDFAESVAAYVYPDVAQLRLERFRFSVEYRELLYYPDYRQTRRWAFIDSLVR